MPRWGGGREEGREGEWVGGWLERWGEEERNWNEKI